MDYVTTYHGVLADLARAEQEYTAAKALSDRAQVNTDVATERRAALTRMKTELERLPEVQAILNDPNPIISNTPV